MNILIKLITLFLFLNIGCYAHYKTFLEYCNNYDQEEKGIKNTIDALSTMITGGSLNCSYMDQYLKKRNVINIPMDSIASVTNLALLAHFTHISYLYLENQEIEDLAPLKNFKNIYDLDLSGNHIKDISVLSKFPMMKYLYLRNNQISKINALSKMNELLILDISYNQITDYTQLKKLKRLGTLYMQSNPGKNISFTYKIPYLSRIRINPDLTLKKPFEKIVHNDNEFAHPLIRELHSSYNEYIQ